MISLSAIESSTFVDARSISRAAVLSPASIAFLTRLIALRNSERWLALCTRRFSLWRAALRADAILAILTPRTGGEKGRYHTSVSPVKQQKKHRFSPHQTRRSKHVNLLKALPLVSSMTLLSRFLGFLRDTVIARAFGAGTAMDAFIIAFRIPNLLRRLFAEGAFAQAFVPILAEYKHRRGDVDTRLLVDHVSGLLAVTLFVITLIGVAVAPVIVYISA